VRARIGPVASFKMAVVIERLPKTRSGKILRGTNAGDRRWRRLPNAADDRRSAILGEIGQSLKGAGFSKAKR